MGLISSRDRERQLMSLRGCGVDLEVRLCAINIGKGNIYNGSFNTVGIL